MKGWGYREELCDQRQRRCGACPIHYTAGSDDFNSVKGDLEKGMEVLEKELALFQVMLQQKKLI